MRIRFLRGFTGIITAAIVLAVSFGVSVHAQPYGSGPYGACKVDVGCKTPEIVTTNSGLEVSINLTDGQVLPLGTYTLIITPLNGQGRTFARVEFYLDGSLVSTFTPGEDGTAAYPWNTAKDKGTKVKIVIFDADNSSVTKEFTISISTIPGTGNGVNQLPNTSGGGAANGSGPIDQVVGALQSVVKALPAPVAASIPYLLLLALFILVAMLLWQAQREAQLAKRLRLSVERAKQLAEEKDGFIELASHYLRTPLTLIKGGVDFLGTVQPAVDKTLVDGLLASSNMFGEEIERLLSRATNDQRLAAIQSVSTMPAPKPFWQLPLFWAPLTAVAVLAVGVNALMASIGKSASAVNVLTQLSFFVALGIGLFIAVRTKQAQARDTVTAQQQQDQQAAIDEARNSLIREAATVLAQKLDAIRSYLPRIPEGQAKRFVLDGVSRIGQVLERFSATATVIPPVTAMNFQSFSFSALLSQAQAKVMDAAYQKHVTIVPSAINDVTFASQQPSWLVQVLSSLLDNAVAYSKENSQVEVDGAVRGGVGFLKVVDHGAGIPADKVAELFQPFSKAEGAMQFDHPGLGLSLYLDRLLVGALGGEMHIESQPNHGTTVTVSFPVQ
ncbi:MAG TPA: sensor histidine kinase [Candidatus Saccharimonadales bacterium]|nr:sensor histidine kinase [Candidatus Saccharimonadales bacterium]